MTLILRNSIPFLDLEEKDNDGKTLLLRTLSHEPPYVPSSLYTKHDLVATADTIRTILANGANILAFDNDGRNCLRVLFENVVSGFKCNNVSQGLHLHLRRILTLLLKSGADAHSVDNCGVSVSSFVYATGGGRTFIDGIHVGDLWDAALSQCGCGQDIREFRAGFHRLRSKYSLLYRSPPTSDNLRSLWKGQEDKCPYYDDSPVWCLYSTSPSGECLFGGNEHTCPGPDGKFPRGRCHCHDCDESSCRASLEREGDSPFLPHL